MGEVAMIELCTANVEKHPLGGMWSCVLTEEGLTRRGEGGKAFPVSIRYEFGEDGNN